MRTVGPRESLHGRRCGCAILPSRGAYSGQMPRGNRVSDSPRAARRLSHICIEASNPMTQNCSGVRIRAARAGARVVELRQEPQSLHTKRAAPRPLAQRHQTGRPARVRSRRAQTSGPGKAASYGEVEWLTEIAGAVGQFAPGAQNSAASGRLKSEQRAL